MTTEADRQDTGTSLMITLVETAIVPDTIVVLLPRSYDHTRNCTLL